MDVQSRQDEEGRKNEKALVYCTKFKNIELTFMEKLTLPNFNTLF